MATIQNATDARYVMGSGRPSVNPIGTPQPSLLLGGGMEADSLEIVILQRKGESTCSERPWSRQGSRR
jgi:hypothetical protein